MARGRGQIKYTLQSHCLIHVPKLYMPQLLSESNNPLAYYFIGAEYTVYILV